MEKVCKTWVRIGFSKGVPSFSYHLRWQNEWFRWVKFLSIPSIWTYLKITTGLLLRTFLMLCRGGGCEWVAKDPDIVWPNDASTTQPFSRVSPHTTTMTTTLSDHNALQWNIRHSTISSSFPPPPLIRWFGIISFYFGHFGRGSHWEDVISHNLAPK